MANYSKIKRVELLQSRIAMAVEGNWNLEKWEDIEEVERRTGKLRREAAGRLDEDNALESVTNFIRPYLYQFFYYSHGLKTSLKPLRRPFDRYQSRLEAINIGRDIRQINW